MTGDAEASTPGPASGPRLEPMAGTPEPGRAMVRDMSIDYFCAATMRRHFIDGDVVLEPIGPLHAVSRATAAGAPGKVPAVCGTLVELIPGGQPWPASVEGAAGSCTACARLT